MSDVPRSAGWYPDPDGAAGDRWWNGAGWSDSRRGGAEPVSNITPYGPPVVPPAAASPRPVVYSADNPAPQTAYAAPAATARTGLNTKINPMATYGFVLGLVSIFANLLIVPSVLAIIFSTRGLTRANQLQLAGQANTAKTYAVIGLALGVIFTIIGVVQFLFLIIGVFSSASYSS